MKAKELYTQIYKQLDSLTPIPVDCGQLCDKACCKSDDGAGMYLFPFEEKVYEGENLQWLTIENSEFYYGEDEKQVKIAVCKNHCDRELRPLACRIFPLVPYVEQTGELKIIVDPRANAVCPLAKGLFIHEYDKKFVKRLGEIFALLIHNDEIYDYLVDLSSIIDDYRKFL